MLPLCGLSSASVQNENLERNALCYMAYVHSFSFDLTLNQDTSMCNVICVLVLRSETQHPNSSGHHHPAGFCLWRHFNKFHSKRVPQWVQRSCAELQGERPASSSCCIHAHRTVRVSQELPKSRPVCVQVLCVTYVFTMYSCVLVRTSTSVCTVGPLLVFAQWDLY